MYTIEVPTLDLYETARSGQAFGWVKLPWSTPKHPVFIISSGEHCAKAEQYGRRLSIGCNESDFYDYWFNYFDLATDYADLRSKAIETGGEVRKWAVRYSGTHLLKMPVYDALVASTLWRGCSYGLGRWQYAKICETLGESAKVRIRDSGSRVSHLLPNPFEMLANQDVILEICGNVRGAWLVELLEAIHDGWLDLGFLEKLEFPKALEYVAPFTDANHGARALMWAGFDNARPITLDYDLMCTWDYGFDTVEDFEDWNFHGVSRIGYVQALRYLNNRDRKLKKWDWLTR